MITSRLFHWVKNDPAAPLVIGGLLTFPTVPLAIVAGAAALDATAWTLGKTQQAASGAFRLARDASRRRRYARQFAQAQRRALEDQREEPPPPTAEQTAEKLFETYRRNILIIASSPLPDEDKAALQNLELDKLQRALQELM